MAQVDYGAPQTWKVYPHGITTPDGLDGAQDFIQKYMLPYMKVQKYCATLHSDDKKRAGLYCAEVILLNGWEIKYDW